MSFTTSDLHDPLQINLQRQTRALLDLLPDSPQISRIKLCTSNSQILQALSVLLADAKLTLLISALFRPVLLDLCARWLDDEDEIEKREDQLVALALLIEVHEELYPILNELLLKPVFANGPLGFITSPPSPLSFPVLRLHRLLIAYYRIQQANRELPLHFLWSLTPLSYLVWTPHLDNGVRLLAIRCYALQSGMAECEREKMEREVLGESCGVECRLFYGETIAGKKEEADGWLLPLLELKRVKAMRDGILNPMDYYSQEIGDGFLRLRSSDLSPRVANIHGVFLTRSPTVQLGFSSLVATPTAIQALRSLALHISTRLPVLLTSSPSAGKSTLLTHLVALLYPRAANQIISIHLADTSLDPRALLGSYISSPTHPGTFEWKEGVLVRAMREGRWVREVLGVLKPLVESLRLGRWIGGRACIQIPNRGKVVAHEEFALFATRSVIPLRDGSFPAPVFFGAHKFHEVEELRMIVESRFPKLAGAAAEGVIRMWDAIKALGSAASSREIGLRELEKFCFRIERLLPNSATNGMDMDEVFLRDVVKNPSVREDVYLEARDVFFGAGTLTSSAQAHVQAIALTVGDHLGLEQERMEWILNGRTPEFHIEKDVNGRTTAVCIAQIDGDSLGRPFAMHRPAILLLSRISTCVSLAEPVLLTGETGTGKTSVITHLASLLRRPLVSLNLSHQTESADLLGGFKPIDARIPAAVLQEQFLELFGGTFSRKKNEKFEGEVRKSVREGKWRRAVSLWKESVRLARERILARQDTADDAPNMDVSRKRRKVEKSELNVSDESWAKFLVGVEEFEVQHVHGKGKFAFGFVEGPLVKALRSGDWVLLDEINLASSETLECISEQGSLEPVPRHPDFRLFACMNPATDVGKKDLPPNIRLDTLLSIVSQYIGAHAVGNKGAIMNVAEFYAAVKDLAEKRQIADGSNHRPHYSMRTLARALTFAADTASTYSLQRSIWEGCLMAFTMVLDRPSAEIVTELAMKHLLSGIGHFYLEKGPLPEDPMDDYITTPSVAQKLVDLARIIITRRFPILIEGPTSSGKTSSIEYLAKRTGHHFVRINNHEHTDIQEYIGSYVSDPLTGKLVFKDGLLVRALRNGHWIVLDELNLAPTDVLEALNRLLDDNRELVVPETQEVIRPHPHFVLFATQNPPGLYAGRKVHFEDVPQAELETILCQRCRIAPSYELQKRRQAGRVFESKHGFATLRDLFRWAGRDAMSYQELANNGYMLLAERTRRDDDKIAVKEVIESIMGAKIDEKSIYNLHNPAIDYPSFLGCPIPKASSNIVWTTAMQRLFILIGRALRFNEPVLLVGETGSGKTSVCQIFANASSQRLHGLNCHQNTETADLIGGLRPLRNRGALEAEVFRDVQAELNKMGDHELRARLMVLQERLNHLNSIFEWHDGPLIEAMRNGDVFLLDEISLADDSVLERLNSVLEPARTIVLAERGGDDSRDPSIQADPRFKLISTMNPGGDFGKKELSPALRNRFTEIWVPRVDARLDLELIVVLDFVEWLCAKVGDQSLVGLRDILAWVEFSNSVLASRESMDVNELFHHAAHMVLLDGLGSFPQLSSYSKEALRKLRSDAREKLNTLVPPPDQDDGIVLDHDTPSSVQFGPFAIPKGQNVPIAQSFNFQVPTTHNNILRLVRACQVPKPILLEGSPGVGKTSLVTALANIAGHRLCRINLSDQTDLVDLFGSDLPVEGGGPGEFAWKDAEFLIAMQDGHWVLLDEMNLAPQAVLEGLNAVLDHRGTVYIPELSRSFTRHPAFRIFAAQNPLNQGGGRKGLPKSFVNRFTKVYIEELSPDDLFTITKHLFPDIDEGIARAMISFNMRLNEDVCIYRRFGRDGGPWEFNLRDVVRWATLIRSTGLQQHPVQLLRSVYVHRFRTIEDRQRACAIFEETFSISTSNLEQAPTWVVSPDSVEFGHFSAPRRNLAPLVRPGRILKMQLSIIESIGHCISQSWLSILTGPRNSGKTELIKVLANLTGTDLHEVSINSATDTMDLLGSFEQIDLRGRVLALADDILVLLDSRLRTSSLSKDFCDQSQIVRNALRESDLTSPSLLHVLLSSTLALRHELDFQVLHTRVEQLLSVAETVGRFEWVDGPLVRALKHGHWLLIDGANLCNPSVLDRLNSLCEPDGFLTLSERGYVNGNVQILKPHPNFRLFMTVDPQQGELSRAMRNRGIEISLLGTLIADDHEIVMDFLRVPPVLSSGNSKQGHLAFNAARRGVWDVSGEFQCISTSGRALDQDSALSNLVDHAPMLVASPTISTEISDAEIHFLARTTTPAYLPQMFRMLNTLEIEGSLNLSRIHRFIKSSGFSSERPQRSSLDTQHSFGPIGLILVILQEVDNIGRLALENLTHSESPDMHEYLQLAQVVLRFGRQLGRVLQSSPFDFSAVHAITRWIVDELTSCPPHFLSVRNKAKTLYDTVTSSSGIGLIDIWLGFFSDQLLIPPTELHELDFLSCRMIGPTARNLRRSTFDLLALCTLPFTRESDNTRILQLKTELESRLVGAAKDTSSQINYSSEPLSVVAELGVLVSSGEENSHKALRSCIIPHRISELSPNRQEVITEIGTHWIALGRLLVQLFVPKAPIDPAAVENYKLERLREEQFVLNSEVYLHSELEKFTTGNDTNELLVHLQTKLQSVERHLGEAPVYPDRKDTSRLHMFWSEVTQFQAHLLEAGKFDSLILELKAGGENSIQRENVTQKTIAGFCQRLNTVYTEYGDVIAPLQLALDYIRLGLRIFVDASTSASTSDVATSALVAFPTVRGLKCFLPNQVLLVALESTLGVVPRTYAQTIDVSYEQALRLWLIDRAKENEEEEASQMLYRRKGLDHDDIGDAEMEEAEFLALFPLFEDILNPDASHTPQTEGRSKPSHHIDLSGSLQLLEIHYGLFGTSPSFDGLGPRLSVFNKHRESAITSLLKTQMTSLSDNMDIESISLQLSILRHRQISLERPIESNLGYNFYQDANVVEAKKSAAVVTALKERLEGIIQEWPDQMVLQHINARCDTFLALTLQSPLAKILSALEQLLSHTEDWQIYANRDNSLKTHQQALIELIVTWRRLELTCWQGLLAAQLRTFEEGVSDWWFRLYDATVRGVLDASQREDTGDPQSLTKYLDSLLPLLDDFLRSSPLGQFQARMRLLHSFETYLLRLSQHKPPSQQLALNRAYHLLHATKRYIKLASWKDINVQALKESAKRTHHQLYKIIRKFREILRQPILEHLHISPANDTESKPSVLPVLPVLADVAPVHLELSDSAIITPAGSSLDFNKTLGKFVTLASTRVQHLIKSQAVQSVDDLAVEIITTSTSLASHAIPSDVSPEARAKQSKALLVRKKRAWGDLLKELKRGGLAVNVKPEILHRQSEVRWIREQAVMSALSLEETSSLPISKIENYFARVAGVLPELRQTMVTHHPDLTTRELHRGAMLLESGFSFAVELRQRLAEALNQFDIISKTHKRLRTLAEQAPPIQPASNLAERVSKISDIICRLASAFYEIQQEMRTFHDLKPKHTISASIFEKVDANYAKIASLRTRLLNVVENVSMTPIAFVVADEESVIFEAVSHVAETVASLRSWTTVQPNLTHLFKPTADWLESQQFPALLPPKTDGAPQTDPTNALINTLLVVLQGLNAQCPPDCADDVPEPDAEVDLYISQSCRTTLQLTHHLHADSINTHLHNVLIHLSRIDATQTPSLHTHVLSRILPFLDIYLMLFRNQLRAHAHTAHALFKLNLVLSTLLRNLAVQGFCQPPEGDSAAEAGSDKAEVGMGLGEGTGAEDVSKDIEEESQVEGLKGDNAEEQKTQDRAEGGDAIEMSEDFGGEMEDVPEDEEEDGDEGEDGEENDVEEKAGGLDEADPEAVDEKLWGDEEGPGDGDDKIGQDRAEEKEGDGDVIAKEGGRQDKDKKQEKQEPKNAENKEAETNDTDGEMQSDQGEGPEDEENDPNEAETLDLPDDMDLGLGEEMAGEPEMEDEGEDMNEDDEQQGQENDMENEGDHGADGPQEVDEIGDDTQKNDMDQEGESAEPAVAQPDVSTGDGEASSNDASNPDTGNRTSTGQSVGAAAGTPGNEQVQEDSEKPKDSNEQTTTTSRSTEAQESGAADQGTQRGGADAPMDEQPRRANPLQNLGDALKEIKQRFDEILDASEENRMDEPGTDPNPPGSSTSTPMTTQSGCRPWVRQATNKARLEELKIVDGMMGWTWMWTWPSDIDMDEEDPLNETVETQLRAWQAADCPAEDAENIWRLYESLTQDLSYALCEQLRLILEPTLATRLRGDYRTGKRLNMKKIIPYIASDYTKDKIWLRRTRPSDRAYQILLALDDSRSMAETHSVHLAFGALALVGRALARLEAGEVAVARFGAEVEVLHGFGEGPFGDEAGKRVMSAFRFGQRTTDVLKLLETSLGVLERARESRSGVSGGAADLWQLEIIISDGMCQDHERMRSVLRRAEEMRVMVVFIIIDAVQANASQSILAMDKAEYKMVDGRMELQLNKYLDSFPFEYYVVLRDVEALPDVLASTLRQFLSVFQRSRPSSHIRNYRM
ncbi:hypothetical protein BD779DRAFT_1609097 [Infundibulicybe gibba]|nr:hypothetical protein BD779DRAFT_1609097 [Infundibulicybe gibba]